MSTASLISFKIVLGRSKLNCTRQLITIYKLFVFNNFTKNQVITIIPKIDNSPPLN